jgi:hypothetical protein
LILVLARLKDLHEISRVKLPITIGIARGPQHIGAIKYDTLAHCGNSTGVAGRKTLTDPERLTITSSSPAD